MIRIITDGACRGNPGPGGWAAIIKRDGEVEELGGREPNTTNNRMEMRAAIEGLRHVGPDEPVHIVTDSEYLMKGITSWIHGWKRRGWKTSTGTAVLNQDLWEELDRLTGKRVTWEHVRGHRGHPENERADEIATACADGRTPPPARAEGDAPAGEKPAKPARPRAAAKAAGTRAAETSPAARPTGPTTPPARPVRLPPWPGGTTYLSLIGGVLQRHTTWEGCRQRVHGAGGARYKKCRNLQEEAATLRSWGLDSDALI